MISIFTAPIPHAANRRAAEQQATLLLARQIAGSQATIAHYPDGAPYIPGFHRHISLSHCLSLAAIAVADTPYLGIDTETWRPQLLRVAHKYLSPNELPLWSASPQLLLQAWTIKEAVYKAARTPGLHLHHINLPDPYSPTLHAVTSDGRKWLISTTEHSPQTLITTAILEP